MLLSLPSECSALREVSSYPGLAWCKKSGGRADFRYASYGVPGCMMRDGAAQHQPAGKPNGLGQKSRKPPSYETREVTVGVGGRTRRTLTYREEHTHALPTTATARREY